MLLGEKTEKFAQLLATREKLSLSLLPSVRPDDHVQPVPKKKKKKIVDEKSKHENSGRGQEGDKWEEAKSLKTDN